jgi:hypothetical protein
MMLRRARVALSLASLVTVTGGAFFLGRSTSQIRSGDRVLGVRPSSVDPCSFLTKAEVAKVMSDWAANPATNVAVSPRGENECRYFSPSRRGLESGVYVTVGRVEADDWERYRRYWQGSRRRRVQSVERVDAPRYIYDLYRDGLLVSIESRDADSGQLFGLRDYAEPRVDVAASTPSDAGRP